jgi:glycosyltransferase involved in cell wall biosynthesis
MSAITGRPLRIAMMLESDGPGGAEYVLIQLSEELRRRGHTIIPIGPDKGLGWLDRVLREQGFETEKFSLRRPVDFGCLRGIVRTLRRRQAEIVHAHEFTTAVYGAAAARIVGIPYVITMHGAQTVLNAWRRRVALAWAFKGSRATVGVSDDTSTYMERTLKLRPGIVTTVRNGIPVRHGSGERVRAELGLTAGELLLLSVGNLVPRKGHRVLLEALKPLAGTEVPLWRLAIAGRGKQKEPLQQLSNELGIADRVHLLGHRDDIPDLLAACDVFVMPSLWEGLPLAILEAMFAGKPVIASAISGIPEAIESGVQGLLVPAGDPAALTAALREVLADSTRRAAFGAAGRRRAEAEFTIGHMTDAYERLYAGRR